MSHPVRCCAVISLLWPVPFYLSLSLSCWYGCFACKHAHSVFFNQETKKWQCCRAGTLPNYTPLQSNGLEKEWGGDKEREKELHLQLQLVYGRLDTDVLANGLQLMCQRLQQKYTYAHIQNNSEICPEGTDDWGAWNTHQKDEVSCSCYLAT